MTDSSDSISLLRTKRYGIFWFSSLLSNIGTWMQSVAEPWLVLSISGSPFLLGLDTFAMNGPFWLLTLWGGALADRRERDRIIYLFQGIQMLCPVLIVFLVFTGWIKAWMIIALSFVVGVTDALSMPSFQSLIPSIVSKKELAPAIALNSIQFNLSRVLGPAIAGIVMLKYGPLWCFGGNALSYIPFFLSVYWLYPRFKDDAHEKPKDGFKDTVKSILQRRSIAGALLSVFITSFFCSPIITFSPVIVREVLHSNVEKFGNVMTAFGIGGLLGPLLLFLAMRRISPPILSFIAAICYGAFVAAATNVTAIWQLGALLIGCGFLLTVANTSANTFLQSSAENSQRGQMSSLFMLAMRGGLSLGNLMTGVVVSLWDVQHALLLNGVLAVAIQVLILLKFSWIE